MAISASRTQHAVRILTLLDVCGETPGGGDPDEAVSVMRSEKRLQALDFWLRNPDYLADELISSVEAGAIPESHLDVAAHLVTDSEPELRHFPTPKWFYGAYERIDDAFALLEAHGLAFCRRRGAPPRRLQSQFFLTPEGASRAEQLAIDDVLGWYRTQAQRVQLVAGTDSGSQLKGRQYDQEQYAQAQWGAPIGSIRDQVLKRLESLGVATVDVAPLGSQPEGTSL